MGDGGFQLCQQGRIFRRIFDIEERRLHLEVMLQDLVLIHHARTVRRLHFLQSIGRHAENPVAEEEMVGRLIPALEIRLDNLQFLQTGQTDLIAPVYRIRQRLGVVFRMRLQILQQIA